MAAERGKREETEALLAAYHEPTDTARETYEDVADEVDAFAAAHGYAFGTPRFAFHDADAVGAIYPADGEITGRAGLYTHALETVSTVPNAGEQVVAHELGHALQRQHLPDDADTLEFETEGFAWWVGKQLDALKRPAPEEQLGMALGDRDDYTQDQLLAVLPTYLGTVVYDAYEDVHGPSRVMDEAMEPFTPPYDDVLETIEQAEQDADNPDLVEAYLSELAAQQD